MKTTQQPYKPYKAPGKSIAELIHDRVHAEGGTLNVWLNGGKFRKVSTQLVPRSMFIRSDEECMCAVNVFEPSPELAAMIRRYAVELREYISGIVRGWRLECQNADQVGSSRRESVVYAITKGRHVRDCHGVTRSEISSNGAKMAAVAKTALAAIVAGLALGFIPCANGRADEISGGIGCANGRARSVWGERSNFNVCRQGKGGVGCVPHRAK